MAGDKTIAARIAAAYPNLSPKHKTLARFLLDNQIFVSFASAMQVGKEAGTSAATVVRFSQALGFAGFSDLQASIREEMPSYLTAVERIQKRLATRSPAATTPQQVFQTDIRNIERTARLLHAEGLKTAIQAIAGADRILLLGAGLSAAPALYLAHSLRVIGFQARTCNDEGLSLAAEMASIREGDLLIVIGLWRYMQSAVKALQTANQNGALTIAFTDSALSPLARVAGHAFVVATEGVAHSLSVTALLSLMNVFIAALSENQPEQTVRSLQRIDAAYKDFNLVKVD